MEFKKFKLIKQMQSTIKKEFIFLLFAAVITSSCRKIFNLPKEKEYLSNNVNFANKILEPVLGRTNLIGGFNGDNSTQPIHFEIVNARYGDGRPVTDIFQKAQTYVWTAAYTGTEKSLAEIEAKRHLEEHPLFEIRSSGEFIMWPSATNDLVTPRPADSTNYPQDTRFFDVKITNTGGERLIRDFQIRPWRERPYDPADDMNLYTGGPAPFPETPYNVLSRNYIRPSRMDNVVGDSTDIDLGNDNYHRNNVLVYIRPFTGGNGHSLRFKVLNKDSVAIDPALFNETEWVRLVHGFNLVKTKEYVQYDVAYPIPLVNLSTIYAPGGSNAYIELKYSRTGFGQQRVTTVLGLNFGIYRAGDWEIVFHFRKDNPRFKDE
ncbi:protein of unknown function [Mucilaginibacter pineti]|uniref:DUF5007 domain-containing protein n=1 Tax=Mucilaginibacter pineti TaxID=1391627 RepID=A0A1G7F2D2_9SPHI|nr:DUF5007 domain-containing protein [Mucilaginibacter pineti]SDE70114.1 protein of unknown function [Mucilaginibacter pineti]